MSGVTAVGTVTVNVAFLQEIKEVDQELGELLTEVRQRCQRPISAGQCRSLLEQLERLRDQLALHFALEEAYGYFDDPAEVRVDVGERADKLRQEHRGLFQDVTEIVEKGEELYHAGETAAMVVWLAPRFLEFDAALRLHESRENELIMDAYDSDIGVGD
jgi:hypothetical protein